MLGSPKTLQKGATTTVDGRPAIALVNPAKKATLYVSTTKPTYPLEIVSTEHKGTIRFDSWNSPVALAPPAHAIDISALQALVGG
jgi:hypothetical protein